MTIESVEFNKAYTNIKPMIVSQFNKSTLQENPTRVIMPNGLTVSCEWGFHTVAYHIAIILYIIAEHSEVIEESKFIQNQYTITHYVDLYRNRNINVIRDNHVFSSTSIVARLIEHLKSEFKNVYDEINKASFIHSQDHIVKPIDLVRKPCEDWISENGKYIWAIRTLYFIKTDFDMWDDNNINDFVNLYYQHFDVNIEKSDLYAEKYNPLDIRTKLKDTIINFFEGEDRKQIESVLETYAPYRASIGVKAQYGSLWVYNFTDTDIDYIVFNSFTP